MTENQYTVEFIEAVLNHTAIKNRREFDELMHDRIFQLAMVRANGLNLTHVPECMRYNEELVVEAIKSTPDVFKLLPKRKLTIKICETAVEKNWRFIRLFIHDRRAQYIGNCFSIALEKSIYALSLLLPSIQDSDSITMFERGMQGIFYSKYGYRVPIKEILLKELECQKKVDCNDEEYTSTCSVIKHFYPDFVFPLI